MSMYQLNGQSVQPPEGWERKPNWLYETGCVKACSVCGEPLWRKPYEEAGVWANKKLHNTCQGEYRKMLGAKSREKARAAKALLPKVEKVFNKSEEQMDLEQMKINLAVDAIVRERMAMPLTCESAGKFAPMAMWLCV